MYMVVLGVGAGANICGYNVHGLTWCGSWCLYRWVQCTWSYLVWELVLI